MYFKLAVIGGTGVYDPDIISDVKEEKVVTPYGRVDLIAGSCRGKKVVFLNRHGDNHVLPPHQVNYRANIAALKKLGVKNVLATGAVGSLNPAMQPGQFIFVDQFLDFTKGRIQSFFDGGDSGVVHVDMTNPYCPELREILCRASRSLGMAAHFTGTYVCMEGPRFETAAEIRMLRLLGGDLVGMTGIPEAVLAREAEMCYATIAMVTNFAAGILPARLVHQEVVEMMEGNREKIRKLIFQAIAWIDEERSCACHYALDPLALDNPKPK